MKKKIVWIVAAVVVVALLVAACFWLKPGEQEQTVKSGTGQTVAVGTETEQTGQTDASGNPITHTGGLQPRPTESMEVEIAEPEYVYLPTQETEDENLIFKEWVTEETESGEPSAKYQNVTEVENAVAIPSVYGKAGETVEAAVKLCGQVELCAFDLRVTYDPSLLKYVQHSNADDDLIVNCDEESGTVMMNFLRTVNVEEVLKVCDLQFEVLTDLTCETPLDVEVVEAISLDENGNITFCNFSIVDAKVHLNESEN